MLVSVVSAVVLTASFGPPQTDCPEDVNGKGFALVFAERPAEGFELFFKDHGKTWEEVPAAQAAALERSKNPWLVFGYNKDASDFNLNVAMTQISPKIDTKMSTDFSGYFSDDLGESDVLNNYGLHDIY